MATQGCGWLEGMAGARSVDAGTEEAASPNSSATLAFECLLLDVCCLLQALRLH